MNAIDCTHLSRSFGRNVALSDVTFSVPEGSFFALLGPNGAGKSTSMKIFLNLVTPSGGEAKVLGKPSTQLRAPDFKRLGYIAEGQDLPEWMTGEQLVAFCRSLYTRWDKDLERKLISTFRVPMDRPIKKLSRGQRMQTSLLSTLPFRPELLLLDEPFSGLDPLVRDDLLLGFLELPNGDRPGTVVISSHDIDEVERLTDEVAFIDDGKLLLRESAEDLRERFRRVEVASAAGITATASGGAIEFRQPSSNLVQFTLTNYQTGSTEAELARNFPGASVKCDRMTLRQIFVSLSRNRRGAVAA